MTTDLAQAPTIVHRFLQRVQQDGDRPALHVKQSVKQSGQFRMLTWQQLADDVLRLALGLADRGIAAGDRVALWAENSYEWILADLAIQLVRAVHVPLHASLAPAQVLQQLEHSQASVLLVATESLLARLAPIETRLPLPLQVVSLTPAPAALPQGRPVRAGRPWLHRDVTAEARDLIENAQQYWQSDSLATILYTSGTTGQPKGVMLSQGNLLFTALGTIILKQLTPGDMRLTLLSLSHAFERTCGLYTWICTGAQLALAESRQTLLEDCAAVAPTVLNGVPYLFQQFRDELERQGRGREPGALRRLLGGRIRCCNSGGAPLPLSLYDFYQHQGVPLLQGYGLTEASPVVATSSPTQDRRGAVGPKLPGTEVRIADDGEILTRGPHVMLGYWRDPATTDQTLRDGWLHTGDLGRIDADGFLWIVGRKKELIVLSTGKHVVPSQVESLLTSEPLIEQALVVGDGRSFLAALIVPHCARLCEAACGCALRDDRDALLSNPAAVQMIHRRIEGCLSCLSTHEQVRRFTLLSRPFSLELGEITPKGSLRRVTILEHFAAQIEAMYAPD